MTVVAEVFDSDSDCCVGPVTGDEGSPEVALDFGGNLKESAIEFAPPHSQVCEGTAAISLAMLTRVYKECELQ